MKRIPVGLSILFVLSIALVLQPMPAFAQATRVFSFNETLTLPGVPLANPCQIGDIILLSGDVHVTGQVFVDGSGGVHLRAHINTANLSGESLTTGTRYQLNAVSNPNVTIDSDVFPINASVDLHGVLVSQSSTDNFAFRIPVNLHITSPTTVIPSLGTPTIECRG